MAEGLSPHHFPFRPPEWARSLNASASEHGVHEGLLFGGIYRGVNPRLELGARPALPRPGCPAAF